MLSTEREQLALGALILERHVTELLRGERRQLGRTSAMSWGVIPACQAHAHNDLTKHYWGSP
jgi:hypothetical protein